MLPNCCAKIDLKRALKLNTGAAMKKDLMERITAKIVVLETYFFIVKLGQKIEIHRKI